MARIIEPTSVAIAAAAEILARGGIVAFPTETVYGLGADTFRDDALARLYAMKGRPAENPLIAHVLDAEAAKRIVAHWDPRCDRLAEAFWPGPLALIVPKAHDVPGRATAGLPTIAVRAPSHPVARALLSAFGGPVSAPSANRSGLVSPTTARHVADDFAQQADLTVLDGGPCDVGLESTVLDLSGAGDAAILRPGSVTRSAIETIIGPVAAPGVADQTSSPGTSPRHYAPRTPSVVVAADQLGARLRDPGPPAAVLCFEASIVPAPHIAIGMPGDADAYGRVLYAALRRADASGAQRIVIEAPPETGELWGVVWNRLRRATAGR